MSGEMKQLIEREKREMYDRRKEETSGVYILFYPIIVVYVVVSILYGFGREEMEDYMIVTLFGFAYFACISPWSFVHKVQENGQRVTVFSKYRYVPVDMRRLFWAKFCILAENAGKVTAAAQLAALLVRVLSFSLGGKGDAFFYPTLFTPFYFGAASLAVEGGIMLYCIKRAEAGRT